jgi:thiopeptide-type bacteriocin biosynthesis protein
VPPASDRLAQPALDAALEATTELHGAGAIALEAFSAGDFGVSPAEHDDHPDAVAAAPGPALLALLVGTLVEAARQGRDVAELDTEALQAACGGVGPAPPPTCELFLAPTRRPPGAGVREGTGWLLGLHAPAGASWGRFAAALGAPLSRALEALAAAEREARPSEEALDVAFAPSPAHADLCAHPPFRRRALALTSWPDDGATALAPRDLALVAAPGAAVPLALRATDGGGPLVPSPLSRVRSSTAPEGVPRLLTGWSLYRQHAPWALALGPLATLPRVPRLVLDGFVVAPASWAAPAGALTRARLQRWRKEAGVPRWIQVGHEDQLLPVDLDAADAPEALAGHERVWELWPPLGETVDRDGRRLEAIVSLIDRPDADEAEALARGARGVAEAGLVPPPRLAPSTDFTTFKLFGAREHQEAVLIGAVGPAVAEARRAREISGWFFQRYIDGPGQRHHLRLRIRAAGPEARAGFEARLAAALAPSRAAGDVTTVEATDYHPEHARWGAALDAVHAVFESDSELALALLSEEDEAPMVSLVGALDALARGLALDLPARHALASARRAAEEALAPPDDEAREAVDAELRVHSRALRGLLSGADPRAAVFEAHATRVARATKATEAAALAPALLHLACVRLAGPDRDLERRAYTLWSRALEGLLKTQR